jgi:mannose-6-phosphate isomerase-like protein (cupin superfamily)
MNTKTFLLLCALAIPLGTIVSDEAAPKGFNMWTKASLAQSASALAQKASKDPKHVALDQLADYANDTAILVERQSDGAPEIHETQVDVTFYLSGSGTLVVGGTLVGGDTVSPHEIRNGHIEGGIRQKVSAGDLVRIPAGAPHQILLDGGKEIQYLVIKVKGY